MKLWKTILDYFLSTWRGPGWADIAFTIVALVATIILAVIPTGYEKKSDTALRVKVLVLSTQDEEVHNYGVVMQGEQTARVRVLGGKYLGQELEAVNILYGKPEMDKMYRPGDRVLAVIDLAENGGKPVAVTLTDHYRLDWEFGLIAVFFFLLLLFGGWTGLKSGVSFAFSAIAIWKLLIPALLAGTSPIVASLGTVTILTAVIVFLVAGFTTTGLAAFLGSLLGMAASAILALLVSGPYNLNGSVRPFSETLRFGGFEHLDITQLFLAGTILASSGALMDLAIDISAALEEVHIKRPDLSFKALALSGLSVSRKVTSTMFTTLILAYTGSYTSLLMVFMAQGVPMANFFNISYVSSEIFQTMIGTFGLLSIAPLTALIGAALFTRKKNSMAKDETIVEYRRLEKEGALHLESKPDA
jgi:uncharacterized membrane protein